jgi:hypothetical protein
MQVMIESFNIPILEIQPSQLFISEIKLAAVQKNWKSTDFIPLPVKELDGRIVLTDGHTRACQAWLSGGNEIAVSWDQDDLDWDAYRIYVGWCNQEGIFNVADLAKRVIPQDQYEVLWIQRCAAIHSSQRPTSLI